MLFYFTMCSYIGLFIDMDDTKSHYSDKCHRNIPLNALKTLSTKLHHLPKLFIFMYNKFVAIASVLGVFQFIRGPKSVQFCFFYLEGEKAMRRSVGPALNIGALLLIFPLFQYERWVCLKIHCWEGKLNGGLDWGWGLPWRHIHLQLRWGVVCFKTFSFQKSEKKKPQTKQTYILKYNLWKRRL